MLPGQLAVPGIFWKWMSYCIDFAVSQLLNTFPILMYMGRKAPNGVILWAPFCGANNICVWNNFERDVASMFQMVVLPKEIYVLWQERGWVVLGDRLLWRSEASAAAAITHIHKGAFTYFVLSHSPLSKHSSNIASFFTAAATRRN